MKLMVYRREVGKSRFFSGFRFVFMREGSDLDRIDITKIYDLEVLMYSDFFLFQVLEMKS